MAICYIDVHCKSCRKQDCDKRKHEYQGTMEDQPCSGECYTCPMAINHHTTIDEEPFCSMHELTVCMMYHVQQHHGVEFYGRVGKMSRNSEIEQAIYQFYSCKKCNFDSIIKQMEEFSGCEKEFILKSGILFDDVIAELKELNKSKCTLIVEIESEIVKILSGEIGLNVVEICNKLKNVVSNNFFIHHITLGPVLDKMVGMDRIELHADKKYYIK